MIGCQLYRGKILIALATVASIMIVMSPFVELTPKAVLGLAGIGIVGLLSLVAIDYIRKNRGSRNETNITTVSEAVIDEEERYILRNMPAIQYIKEKATPTLFLLALLNIGIYIADGVKGEGWIAVNVLWIITIVLPDAAIYIYSRHRTKRNGADRDGTPPQRDINISNMMDRRVTKRLLLSRIQKTFEYLKDNSAFVVKYGVLISLILLFFGAHETPSDPLVAQIQQMVEILGLLAVLITPVVKVIVDGGCFPIAYYIGRAISGIAAYSVVLWMIGQYGVDTKEWIISNPNEAAITGVSFLLVWCILKFSGDEAGLPRRSGAYRGQEQTPTARDYGYMAAHEAGHLMMYAAIRELECTPEIRLLDKSNDGVLGFVRAVEENHLLHEKTYAEWRMLLYLAGDVAEEVMYGESTLGSADDHQEWLKLACPYLECHGGGRYYRVPKNAWQHRQNQEALETLQKSQKERLRMFLRANKNVLEALVAELKAKKRIRGDDVKQYLKRVEIPADYPRPQTI